MIIVTLQREKCIGCKYCELNAPDYFRLSNKDGKAVLLNAKEKKGFFTTHINIKDANIHTQLEQSQKDCPVHIIKVSQKK